MDTRVHFELILTYDTKPQEIYNIDVMSDITEEKFVLLILQNIGKDAHDLVKISCCQYCNGWDELLPFIAKTHGKYYFNTEVNHDSETQKWKTLRDNFISYANRIQTD